MIEALLIANVHASHRFVEDGMAKYKYIDTQPRLIAVDLARQLLPGTIEHAFNHLLDHAVDLSHFDARFRNIETGGPAYPPAVLLKVVLFAYAQGIVGSRGIERARQEHVTFMARCGDHAPHFTTIARCISTLDADIAKVFAGGLAVAQRFATVEPVFGNIRYNKKLDSLHAPRSRQSRWTMDVVLPGTQH